MKYGLNEDGRRCGPIDPLKVLDSGWTWYDTAEEMEDARQNQAPTLEGAKALKMQAVDREYTACLMRGVAYGGTYWDASDESRLVLMELVELAKGAQSAVTIIDRDDNAHQMTLAELQELKSAGVAYRAAARERRISLREAVKTADDSASLEQIDATTGWPG